jgi:hypothetical protein
VARLFANANDLIQVNNATAINLSGSTMTIAAWVKATSLDATQDRLIAKWSDSPGAYGQFSLTIDGSSKAKFECASLFESTTGGTTLSAGTWYHLVGVKNGTAGNTLFVYLNGAIDSTGGGGSGGSSMVTQSTPLRFGCGGDTAIEGPFSGTLAEIGLWDVALSVEEIAALAKGTPPNAFRPDHLKGYWPLPGLSGTEADLSGNGNHGIVARSLGGKTFYLLNSLAGTSNHMSSQDGGTAPATATTGTGWTVAKTAASNYARMDSQTKRVATTFAATAQPSGAPDNTLGDSIRTPNTLTGVLHSANWDIQLGVIAVSAGGSQDGRLRYRVWRSVNQDGSSATEITAATQLSATVTNLTTTQVNLALSATWNPGAVTLSGEYLFFQVAWEITGAASSTSADVVLRVDSNSRFITPLLLDTTSGPTAADHPAMSPHPMLVVRVAPASFLPPSGPVANLTATITPTLTSAAQVGVNATASPTVTPTLTSSAQVAVNATASPTVSPTLTSSAQVGVSGTLAATVTPTLTSAAQIRVTGTLTQTVTPTLTSAAQVAINATASPTVIPTLTSAAAVEVRATATPVAAPTLTSAATVEVRANLTATATPTLTSSATVGWAEITATLNQTVTPTLASTTGVAVRADLTATAAPTLASAATVEVHADLTATVAPTLTSATAVAVTATTGVTVTPTLTSTATVQVRATASPTVTPTLTSEAFVGNAPAVADLNVTVTPTLTVTATAAIAGSVSATVTATLASAAAVTVTATASLTVTPTLTATTGVRVTATATPVAAATVTSTAQVAVSGSVSASVPVSLTSSATVGWAERIANLTATVSPTLTSAATVLVRGDLSATSGAALSATATVEVQAALAQTIAVTLLSSAGVQVMGSVVQTVAPTLTLHATTSFRDLAVLTAYAVARVLPGPTAVTMVLLGPIATLAVLPGPTATVDVLGEPFAEVLI